MEIEQILHGKKKNIIHILYSFRKSYLWISTVTQILKPHSYSTENERNSTHEIVQSFNGKKPLTLWR